MLYNTTFIFKLINDYAWNIYKSMSFRVNHFFWPS